VGYSYVKIHQVPQVPSGVRIHTQSVRGVFKEADPRKSCFESAEKGGST